MLNLFRALIDRVKAMLASVAAAELHADALARVAERKAELLRLAEGYDDQGLGAVADQLRQRAEALDSERPLASVLATSDHLLASPTAPALPALAPTSAPAVADARKKGR